MRTWSPRSARALVLGLFVATAACGSGNDAASSSAAALSAAQCAAAKPWSAGVTYAAGDVVSFGGATYQCIQGHASQAAWTPDVTASLWARATCDGGSASNPGGGASNPGGGACGASGSTGGTGGTGGTGNTGGRAARAAAPSPRRTRPGTAATPAA